MSTVKAVRIVASVLLCFLTLVSANNQDACNFETHHSHLVIPLTSTQSDCVAENAPFLLSHGATFFCPHPYDVKLLATFDIMIMIDYGDDVNFLISDGKVYVFGWLVALTNCSRTSTTKINSWKSINMAVILRPEFYAAGIARPTLPENGLPATGTGAATSWISPVLYYVHSFGTNSSAGPGDGWNTTTIASGTVGFHFKTLYFREFELVSPKPSELSYMIFYQNGMTFITHYITSAPNFDQIAYVKFEDPSVLWSTWPLLITVNGRADAYNDRLVQGEQVLVTLHQTSATTGLPYSTMFQMTVTLDIYHGVDDGFADFGFNCYFPPDYPQQRGLCPPPGTSM